MRNKLLLRSLWLWAMLLVSGSVSAQVAKIGTTEHATLQEAVEAAPDGVKTTVTVIDNVDLPASLVIPATKNIILDLNSKTVSYTKTTISNLGILEVKSGTIVSTTHCGIAVGTNSTTTFTSGTIESVEGAIITGKSTGATIKVAGGVLKASDNAVISGNGTNREGAPNTFSITGGKLYGSITTPGYIACGIYAPWKDIVNIAYATIEVEGGCGILVRGGDVNLKAKLEANCKIITTGTATGKVGDAKIAVPCSAIVFDSKSSYPGMTADSKIVVLNGTYKSADGVDAVAYVAPEGGQSHISVEGGVFSSILSSDVCASSFASSTEPNAEGLYVVEKYKGMVFTGTDITANQTLDQFKAIRASKPNAIMLVDNNDYGVAELKETNVVVNNGTKNICDNFVLTDLSYEPYYSMSDADLAEALNFYSPITFTATNLSYKRKLKAGFNSVSLPFEYTAPSNAVLLQYESNDNSNVYFTEEESIAAGQGSILKSEVAQEWVVNLTNVDVCGTPDNNGAYIGAFVATDDYAMQAYSVRSVDNTFTLLNNYLFPFRSCFYIQTGTSNARTFNLAIVGGDGNTTAIETIDAETMEPVNAYNLNGQRVTSFQKGGMYIINGKKVIK